MTLEQTNAGWVISAVQPYLGDSLRAGDRIVAVGGRDMVAKSLPVVIRALRGAYGEIRTMEEWNGTESGCLCRRLFEKIFKAEPVCI